MARSRDKYAPDNAESLQLGAITGNCLEAWSSPETVENAHDLGNREIYRAPTRNNAYGTPSRAPEANR